MTLPAPNLDDRRFQDLVDDAKRLVQQRCPAWSDHNVSDPGVTLIEAFAHIADQLIYRLNRVPDRHYVKFLELLGIERLPATAAHTEVTFWLSAPHPDPLPVARGTEVGRLRTNGQDDLRFSTLADLEIVPCTRRFVASSSGSRFDDHTSEAEMGTEFACFGGAPAVGDALYVGLSNSVPSCAVAIRLGCRTQGHGVTPTDPPLVWEASCDDGWHPCEVNSDRTLGLNQSGDVVVHVPASHRATALPDIGVRAAWLRCRLVEARAGQSTYSDSPLVSTVEAFTIGGTVAAVHAAQVEGEVIGLSEGVPGQRFELERRPVVAMDDPLVLEVAAGKGWARWERVRTFAHSGPDDEHFTLDETSGEIRLGPAVRDRNGTMRSFGAVPPKGAPLRVVRYWSGGGPSGNVAAGTITQLKSSVPRITRVENRRPARHGVDAERMEDTKERAPIVLRSSERAVTAEDHEVIARRAAPELARVHCVPAAGPGEAGGVRILLVPRPEDDAAGAPRFDDLVPSPQILERVRVALDRARVIGTRIVVEPPTYVRVVVVAMVRSRPRGDLTEIREDAIRAVNRRLHPVLGGADGTGWPFGRTLQTVDVHAALTMVPDVEVVEDVRLFWVDPDTGERSDEVTRVDLPDHALLHLYEHQIRVVEV